MKRKEYEKKLAKLHGEMVHLQEWVKSSGARIIVVFEGRDAAGKGGMIKAMTDRVSPRVFHKVALPAPTDREKTQIYFQRYIREFPAAGEVTVFDRSWYNRAGVEIVMGFCTDEQRRKFLEIAPRLEQALIDDGIILVKYWLEVSSEQQEKRFRDRITDARKQWKLSPMDLESRRRWYAYSRARDEMMVATDTEHAPWHIIRSDDKRAARLNCISHFLSQIPYEKSKPELVQLPERDATDAYDDEAAMAERRYIPELF
ncbi:MAG: polyphosphate kinase 2 [Gammaproteobacteria bacterium]|nr:polyphosphate kinase 2 [Gammaproteobacteria bacterium]